jgi:hypothetical protein
MSITNQVGLKEGDNLTWNIEAENKGLIVKIKPLE